MMKTKKLLAVILSAILAMTSLVGCSTYERPAPSPENPMTVQIGFENSLSEPIGQALVKWQELVEKKR